MLRRRSVGAVLIAAALAVGCTDDGGGESAGDTAPSVTSTSAPSAVAPKLLGVEVSGDTVRFTFSDAGPQVQVTVAAEPDRGECDRPSLQGEAFVNIRFGLEGDINSPVGWPSDVPLNVGGTGGLVKELVAACHFEGIARFVAVTEPGVTAALQPTGTDVVAVVVGPDTDHLATSDECDAACQQQRANERARAAAAQAARHAASQP